MKFIYSTLYFLINKFPKIFWLLRPKYYQITNLNLYFYKLLKKKLKNKKSNILELGCSSGHLLNLLGKNYKNVNLTGCDISLLNILYAKLRFLNNRKINVYHKDFTKLNFIDYNIIISQATLIYLSEKQVQQLFEKIFATTYTKCYFLELGVNSNFKKKDKSKHHFHLNNYFKIINKLKKKIYIKRVSIKELKNLNWYSKDKNILPYFIELN